MNIDTRFPTKLGAIHDAPEQFHNVLVDNFSSKESVRLLVHAPTFSTMNERSAATVLAVTDTGWLVASANEDGSVSLEKSTFSETLFLELTSILLFGQLKIYFATVGTTYSASIRFDTVGEEFYREAIDLMVDGIDPLPAAPANNDRDSASISEAWPIQFRNEAQRYRPKDQRLLAATQWPAVIGGFQRELSPGGALLVTTRELVLISEEKASPRQHAGDLHKFGGIITYFPLTRLADFHLSHHERFEVLALEVHAMHGGEKLETIFPSDHEKAVSKAMEQALIHAGDTI
jgi:hypothetical protein